MNWLLRGRRVRKPADVSLDEVFMDSSNVAMLDTEQMEGRVERPISRVSLGAVGVFFLIVAVIFSGRAFNLQIMRGEQFAAASNNNRLSFSLVFAERGVIYDRVGEKLAWNEAGDEPYAHRIYSLLPGLSHLVGYVRYPRADTSGIWWRTELAGVSGVEKEYDAALSGLNGKKIVEVNALGEIQREHITEPAQDGKSVTLSVDAAVQSKLHELLAAHAKMHGFRGGAAVIMDVTTGELLAVTSFPEYDQEALVSGDSTELAKLVNDPQTPFLFRAVSGLYTPGSIVKPFIAAAALDAGVITPEQSILSTGQLVVPNPYDSSKPSIFKDWKAHGWVNMRQAIKVSSDVYFYEVGGGFENQKGLGITKIDDYARRFGFGELPGGPFADETAGVIPTPQWKEATFNGDPWRLGDTYISAIGQFGWQTSPLQAVRATAALANGGTLHEPTIIKDEVGKTSSVAIDGYAMQVAREGMRAAVTDSQDGTARSINASGMTLAGKTGTAEVGSRNQWMNSWVIGFWPYENPKYAFAVVLEHAPAGTLAGAAPAMGPFFRWLASEHPEYARPE